MKRFLFILSFFLLVSTTTAQDYQRVDAAIKLYPERFAKVDDLAEMIARDFIDPKEQLRAAYGWIIDHVVYDPDEYKNFNYNFKDYRERNLKEEQTRAKIITRTISEGVAVCEGYAMLFEQLCFLLGIESYLVRGDIKTHFDDIGRSFETIHMWNLAIVEGQSFLFDPTWGAGKYQDRFIHEPSYRYFMAEPGWFINTHYPDFVEDTLLEDPLSRSMFEQMPLIISQGMLWEQVIEPKFGILDATVEDGQIRFELEGVHPKKVSYDFGSNRRKVKTRQDGDVLLFEVPMSLGSNQLVIYFDGKPALAYKIE